MLHEFMTGLGYAAAYIAVGVALLVLGYLAWEAVTVRNNIATAVFDGSWNAALLIASGWLGQGAIAFTNIWVNGSQGIGDGVLWTAGFGIFTLVVQVAAFLVLDLMTPGRLYERICEVGFAPFSLWVVAGNLAVSAIICASIVP